MMNVDEDDGTYHADSYAGNGQKFPVENAGYDDGDDNDADDDDVDDDDDDDDDDGDGVEKGIIDHDEDEEDDDDDEGNGIQRIGKDDYDECDDEDVNEDGDLQRHPKKRKLKTLLPSYEFAPRVPTVPTPPSAPKPPYGGGRNPLTDWTEHETFTLLDSWGERYLKQGKKSLRSEEWQEVAEKVSQESKLERTDTQCRNRLDTLKKKYKKEKSKPKSNVSEWVYFKKMDSLLSNSPNQTGLSCGVDSGEYVFTNPKVYLNRSNGFDEMRDSPVNSGDGDESEGRPPKRAKNGRVKNGGGASFKILADSFQKFSKIYEKIEDSKRKQMMELEKMRMDFHRDLELQKRQILERAQAEIAKIWQGDDEENTVSAENVSG